MARRRTHLYGLWTAVFAAALLVSAVQSQPVARAADVPDPSLMLPLVPGAANAGPPPIIKTGTRLVYFNMTATLPGPYQRLVPGVHGKHVWTDKNTGQQFTEEQAFAEGSGGEGYNVVHVGYVDQHVVQLSTKLYLKDPLTGVCMLSGGGGLVTEAGCAADYWINPAVLAKVPVSDNGVTQVLRMPYPVNGKVYQAIVFQGDRPAGVMVWVYDLKTGLLIHNSSCTRGAPVLTPPPGGQEGMAGVAHAGSFLASGHLVQVKDVPMPWRAMAPPPWVAHFQRLRYSGVQTTLMRAALSPLNRPMTMVLMPKARGHGWLRFSSHTVIQSIMGLPPEQHSGQSACGDGSIGLWIPPQALADLEQGQVLERNSIVHTTVVVSDTGGDTVTISEIGEHHRVDNTYDANSGILSAMRISKLIGQPGMGQANFITRVRLMDQP